MGLAQIDQVIPDAWLPEDDLENQVSSLALRTVFSAAIILLVLVFAAVYSKERHPRFKMPIFVLMATAMAGSVIVLLGSTIYLNSVSESGGPIHWHADIEYWACGNQLEFRDPSGALSNKIGSTTFHEHDDQRLHLEGVVVEKANDASLGKFMYVTGGLITDDALIVPLNEDSDRWYEDKIDGDGETANYTALVAPYLSNSSELGMVAQFIDGQTCGEQVADVQTYVYHYEEDYDVYWQEKLSQPQFYSIAEDPNVPPGDCIIVEFGPTAERTSKLCPQYGIRDIDRCEEFGVDESKRGICTIREVAGISDNGEIIELDLQEENAPSQVKPLEGIDEVLEAPDA